MLCKSKRDRSLGWWKRQIQPLVIVLSFLVACWGSASADSPTSIQEMRDRIDAHLESDWKARNIDPAPACTDSEFLRRSYLDLIGRVPRVSESREFLESTQPDRRENLIGDLVSRPGYATRMANAWREFLLPVGTDLEASGGIAGFETWLRERIALNMPYNELVTELLQAEGDATQSGPALFFTAWELKPEKLAASTSRAFLGMQVQCAECHDHPFDQWSQKDFWGYAAFFARLQSGGGQLPPGVPAQSFIERQAGEVTLPDTEEVVLPKHLGDTLEVATNKSRRKQLAAWIVDKKNPYFAKATVNRLWTQLFGRGIVDPPSDMGEHNPPSHPELLDDLATYFQETNYDVRRFMQTVAGTRAYQLSSMPSATKPRPYDAFAEMPVKSLTAEQLYDSLATATCKLQPANNGGQTFGINRVLDRDRQAFLGSFRAPSNVVTDYQLGMTQALTMLNGVLTNEAGDVDRSDLLGAINAPFFTDEDRIETVFLAAFSRKPTEKEKQRYGQYVADAETDEEKQQALGDLFWALLNSSEFTLNR